MSSTEPFVRIHHPTAADLDRCIAADRPAILTGTMDDQVAQRAWDLPYLCGKLGGQTVKVVEQDEPRVYWHPASGLPIRSLEFEDFAEATFARPRPGYRYLQDDVNAFPSIKDDYRLPPMIEAKTIFRAKLWMSGSGLVTPLHYDPCETLHWMIRGTKRFLFFPPGVGRYYPYPARSTASFISRCDPDHPQPERFPRFRAARPLELTLVGGELLYLPAYWWHQVYSEAAVNVSLNFIWEVSPWRSLRRLGQYVRARRHLHRSRAKARALAQSARRAA